MYIGAAVLLLLSTVSIWFFSRRYTLMLSHVLLGVIIYVVFIVIFLGLFNGTVLYKFSHPLYVWIYGKPSRYVIYYGLLNAMFYGIGIYTASRMSMKETTDIGPGFGLSLGLGTAYVFNNNIFAVGSNLLAARQINASGADAYLASAEGSEEVLAKLRESVSALIGSTAPEVLYGAAECALMFLILSSAAMLIYLAVTHRCPFGYIGAGFAIIMLAHLPAALLSSGSLTSTGAMLGLLALFTAVSVAVVVLFVKKYGKNQLKI
jgi:uncharacterized membrane protein YhfC